eukprot:TRINITY_DN1533_c0_g2_i1.p1 TRINITY_DN1533_c0_g2~~TRINITY_DN1533_c0_g2_i1.p1  ORF type:complete len:716 (+),score=219.80 TRINITY_DN1533_c0_g2_i1:54-2201(+)
METPINKFAYDNYTASFNQEKIFAGFELGRDFYHDIKDEILKKPIQKDRTSPNIINLNSFPFQVNYEMMNNNNNRDINKLYDSNNFLNNPFHPIINDNDYDNDINVINQGFFPNNYTEDFKENFNDMQKPSLIENENERAIAAPKILPKKKKSNTGKRKNTKKKKKAKVIHPKGNIKKKEGKRKVTKQKTNSNTIKVKKKKESKEDCVYIEKMQKELLDLMDKHPDVPDKSVYWRSLKNLYHYRDKHPYLIFFMGLDRVFLLFDKDSLMIKIMSVEQKNILLKKFHKICMHQGNSNTELTTEMIKTIKEEYKKKYKEKKYEGKKKMDPYTKVFNEIYISLGNHGFSSHNNLKILNHELFKKAAMISGNRIANHLTTSPSGELEFKQRQGHLIWAMDLSEIRKTDNGSFLSLCSSFGLPLPRESSSPNFLPSPICFPSPVSTSPLFCNNDMNSIVESSCTFSDFFSPQLDHSNSSPYQPPFSFIDPINNNIGTNNNNNNNFTSVLPVESSSFHNFDFDVPTKKETSPPENLHHSTFLDTIGVISEKKHNFSSKNKDNDHHPPNFSKDYPFLTQTDKNQFLFAVLKKDLIHLKIIFSASSFKIRYFLHISGSQSPSFQDKTVTPSFNVEFNSFFENDHSLIFVFLKAPFSDPLLLDSFTFTYPPSSFQSLNYKSTTSDLSLPLNENPSFHFNSRQRNLLDSHFDCDMDTQSPSEHFD